MNITFHKSPRAIRPGDRHFTITDGLVVTGRAAIEVSQRCPDNYKSLIQECIGHGWLKPVAYATAEEYMIMQLSK
jgi:hypothetical protein